MSSKLDDKLKYHKISIDNINRFFVTVYLLSLRDAISWTDVQDALRRHMQRNGLWD